MRNTLLGVLLGMILHMIYLDLLVINQHLLLEKCDVNSDDNQCIIDAQNSYDKFYGKYFGVYRLLNYNNISTGKWQME